MRFAARTNVDTSEIALRIGFGTREVIGEQLDLERLRADAAANPGKSVAAGLTADCGFGLRRCGREVGPHPIFIAAPVGAEHGGRLADRPKLCGRPELARWHADFH